ncbi:MAG: hypothetical protein MUE42_02575 [Opitutaceae bacterium]|jgi:hypothetical protein|nr:hypothetical protein [Opitutaceae bacterium]
MPIAATLQPQVFPWNRYWFQAEQTLTLDEGFLAVSRPDSRGDAAQTVKLRRIADLEDVPCLVLLGAPGMGKSHELRMERDRLVRSATSDLVLHVDLKNLGPESFRDEVFGDERFLAWRDGRQELTLILDSLDECWEQIRDLIPTIVHRLKPGFTKPNHPALKLRLGCRAAEWRAGATEKIEALFGKPDKNALARVQLHQLAPLTREDVALAAAILLGQTRSDAFLTELATHDLNALAAHPLTLDLLLADAREGRALGPTRADIYRRGMLRLAHDPHEDPAVPPRNRHTTQETRRRIAGQVAAHGVLSRRYLYRLPNSAARPSPTVLEPDDLLAVADIGPDKTTGQKLTSEALRETYRCGLFRSAGGDCVTWQHQAYAEFLAAEYLVARKPVRNEKLTRTLLGLVSDASAVEPRIYPPLEELALWLVELHPQLFEPLLPSNGDVLIRCHHTVLTEPRRAQIVDLYFEQIRRHEAEAQDGEITLPLARLKHPGLAAQLRAVLLNRAESVSLRRTTLSIIDACNTRELIDDLIDVIFRENEDVAVTHAAAWLLRRWAKDDTTMPEFAPSLRERLLATPERADLEVLGCILPILWPACLSTEELLPFLNHHGDERSITSYDMMLHSDLVDRVRPADMRPILRWAAGLSLVRNQYPTNRQAEFIQKIVRLAFSQWDTMPELLPAVVTLAVSWANYERPPILAANDEQPIPQAARRAFWRALLVETDQEKLSDVFSQLTTPRGVFFAHEDLAWAVGEAVSTVRLPIGSRWENLVSWLTRWEEQADIETIWPLVVVSESFASLVPLRTSHRLIEYERPNWRKEQYYREQEAERQRRALPPIEARLGEALDHFAQGKGHTLWWATEVLFLVECKDGRLHPPHGREELPVRCVVTAAFHARFRTVARNYLSNSVSPSADELVSETTLQRHVCAVRLAGYLAEYALAKLEAFSGDWWGRWMPALLVYQSYAFGQDDAIWNRIIEMGHSRNREGFYAALRVWLHTGDAVGIDSKTWFGLPLLADPVVREVLREQALSEANRHSHVHALGRTLLKGGDAEFEKALAERMPQRGPELLTCHPQVPMAAALLLSMRAESWAATIADEMAGDPVWARAVLQSLNTSGGLAANWITYLSPDLLARLWETLKILVPNSPWKIGEASFVTLEHEVARLQSFLLNQLHAQTSPQAVTVLDRLIARHPTDADWMGRMLAHVRRAARREGWSPMEPQAAARFLRESGPRPIQKLGDLCDAVMDSLERYQAYLHAPNRPTELWNERGSKHTIYTPKDENVLSNCLITHLRRDLGLLNVWGEREVEVRRGTATEKGDNPDIIIIAPNPAEPAQPLRLYIEVKCSWNLEAISGMGAQLFDRYLRTADCGIYVLAHYDCPTWNDPKDKRQRAPLHHISKAEARAQLEAECLRLQPTRPDKRLAAFFLDASL